MDDIEVDNRGHIYSPVGESTRRSQGRKDSLAADLRRNAWRSVSGRKCLVPKRQGGTPRLRLALPDGGGHSDAKSAVHGCDMPGSA